MDVPMRVTILLLVFFAAPWLLLVGFAESHCPVIRDALLGTNSRCGEGDGPIWFVAMVTSPIGGFALLGLLLVVLGRLFRR